jgi:hypothetical protein
VRRARLSVYWCAALAAVSLAWAGSRAVAQSPDAQALPVLRDLRGVAELSSAFDSDNAKVRIVMLLSPT